MDITTRRRRRDAAGARPRSVRARLGLARIAPTRCGSSSLGRKYSLWVFNSGWRACATNSSPVDGAARLHPARRHPVRARGRGRTTSWWCRARSRTRCARDQTDVRADAGAEERDLFGAASNCGGRNGIRTRPEGGGPIIPVDVYVPGCPPRPEALLQGILKLQRRSGGVAGGAVRNGAGGDGAGAVGASGGRAGTPAGEDLTHVTSTA